MKKMKLAALALALTGILAAGNALAATANLTVTAEVDGTCGITAGTLDLGLLNPTSGLAVSVSNPAAATIICTNGTGWAVTAAPNGGAYNLAFGANLIPYALSFPNGTTGTGSGFAQDIEIQGDIAFVDYQSKPAGVYTHTVVLTVTP